MKNDIPPVVEDWLARLNAAAADPTPEQVGPLFEPDSHWREAVAFSWELKTLSGRDRIAPELAAAIAKFEARGFAIDPKC